MKGDDIVISGFSAYFPQADHLVEFKEKLYAGVDFATEDDARWPRGKPSDNPHHPNYVPSLFAHKKKTEREWYIAVSNVQHQDPLLERFMESLNHGELKHLIQTTIVVMTVHI
ncbi:hypothetical protein MRX96_054889 [Rhipicephalus microplus]